MLKIKSNVSAWYTQFLYTALLASVASFLVTPLISAIYRTQQKGPWSHHSSLYLAGSPLQPIFIYFTPIHSPDLSFCGSS